MEQMKACYLFRTRNIVKKKMDLMDMIVNTGHHGVSIQPHQNKPGKNLDTIRIYDIGYTPQKEEGVEYG